MPFTTAQPSAFRNQDNPITEVMELLKKVVPGYNDRTRRRLIKSRDGETFWVHVAVYCGAYESYSNSHFYLVEKEVAKAIIAEGFVQATIDHGGRRADDILEVSRRGKDVFFEWSRQRQKEEEWKKEPEKTFKDAGGIPHSAETFD